MEKKNGHGNGCRQRPNSYNLHAKAFLNPKILRHEMVTGKQNSKLFSSAGLPSQTRVELWWSLCRSPMLSVWGPALSVSIPTLCVGAQRSLCRGPALSVSGPGALYLRARRSLRRAPALSLSGHGALCVGARRSLCRAPAFPASGPGALPVGPDALCVGGALGVRAHALCVGARRSLCRATAGASQGERRAPTRRPSESAGPDAETAGARPRAQRLQAAPKRCEKHSTHMRSIYVKLPAYVSGT